MQIILFNFLDSWEEDYDYLAPFGFVTSRPMNKFQKPVFLTDEQQQDAIKNRDKW